MLHSTYAHKNTYEDPKTSSVFENLMLLPDDIFWHILKSACFYDKGMPVNAGKLVAYKFWPHWSAEGTHNSSLVEPDLFLRFEEFDVIIEAKYGDSGGQYKPQWENELIAYDNEYHDDGKPVVFIAVGGNMTVDTKIVEVQEQKHLIYKCSWLSLLIQANRYRAELEHLSFTDMRTSSMMRILDNTVLAFNINGVYNMDWFKSMAREKCVINPDSIEALRKHYKI